MNINLEKSTLDTSITDKALSDVLQETLRNKGLENNANPNWEDDKTLIADDIPKAALHSFLLKAEELGLGYKMERKLTITFTQ